MLNKLAGICTCSFTQLMSWMECSASRNRRCFLLLTFLSNFFFFFFYIIRMNVMVCCFRVKSYCAFVIRSCARLVLCAARIPRSFALSHIGKITCFAFDFVHNSLDLICGGAVFWFLKDTAQCFNRLESGSYVFSAKHTSKNFRKKCQR